jgi:outer membrane protein OmpA-like peptidoglycan-associated protein
MSILVEGHTDNSGNAESDKNFSLSRTNIVREALTKAGISEERVKAVGYEQEKPIANNSKEQSRFMNRRVDVIIFGK